MTNTFVAECVVYIARVEHRAAPIVFLEDDPNDAYFIRHAFEKARIVNPLVRFETATSARQHFAETAPFAMPVLFVMDVHLASGETGIDFLRWLRQQRAPLGSTPVMMLSGSHSPADREEAATLGSIYFLRKPVTDEALTTAVQSLGFVITSLTGFTTERTIERAAE
jgi:CheY-like chemotaxis protein